MLIEEPVLPTGIFHSHKMPIFSTLFFLQEEKQLAKIEFVD